MNIEVKPQNGVPVALVSGPGPLITDAQSALDLLATVSYEAGCQRMALPKSCVAEDFFILSTGLAGEVLQKFVNYRMKIAVYGDFSRYTSKPLRDFFYECNSGQDIFFVATEEEALARLAGAQ